MAADFPGGLLGTVGLFPRQVADRAAWSAGLASRLRHTAAEGTGIQRLYKDQPWGLKLPYHMCS